MSTGRRFESLLEIMDKLRDPGGCPWDAEQTMESLQPYLIEEAYECLEAMESGDRAAQCEELGDLLLQVVFQSRIAKEEQAFSVDEVIEGICDKLVRRHPHVFAEQVDLDAEGVERRWEQIKLAEKKGQKRSIVDGIPPAAPALQRASRLGEKVARVGLDWERAEDVRGKIDEELAELDESLSQRDPAGIEEEFGDLLFTLAQWGRHLGLDSEATLRAATRKFTDRVRCMEAILETKEATWERAADVEVLWQQAKTLRREGLSE